MLNLSSLRRAVRCMPLVIVGLFGISLLVLYKTGDTQIDPSTLVDRQVIVKMEPDQVELNDDRIRVNINQVRLPQRMKELLQAFRAEEIKKALPDFQKADSVKVFPDGRIYRSPNFSNYFVITLPPDVSRDAVLDSLSQLPEVVAIEKNQRIIFKLGSTDPHYPSQWNMKNTGQSGGAGNADINIEPAWDLTTGSSSVIIGLVDSGLEETHPEFQGTPSRFTGNLSTPYSPHGTQVAGILAAAGDNGIGMAGVDWRATIYSARANVGAGSIPEITTAVHNAVLAGARVLNNSWGVESNSQMLYDEFAAAYRANVLPVGANSQTGAPYADFPNQLGAWVLNVAATTDEDDPASYSLSKRYTDVAAPGGNGAGEGDRNILSTYTPNNGYATDYGTSFAAPHVTGVVGLMLAQNPNLKNYDLEWIINRAANPVLSGPYPRTDIGYGRLDAYEAVRRVVSPYEISRGSASFTQVASNQWIYFSQPPNTRGVHAFGWYYCDVYKLSATVTFPQPYTETPWAWLSQTGYPNYNYIDGRFILDENTTTTSTTVATYFYYLRLI